MRMSASRVHLLMSVDDPATVLTRANEVNERGRDFRNWHFFGLPAMSDQKSAMRSKADVCLRCGFMSLTPEEGNGSGHHALR